MQIHREFTLERNDDYAIVRIYETKTMLLGDQAFHKGTKQIGWLKTHIDDLGKVMRERKINEFCREDDMQWLVNAPED